MLEISNTLHGDITLNCLLLYLHVLVSEDTFTARKGSVFKAFLVRIFPHSD